jgi:hypothetical protein
MSILYYIYNNFKYENMNDILVTNDWQMSELRTDSDTETDEPIYESANNIIEYNLVDEVTDENDTNSIEQEDSYERPLHTKSGKKRGPKPSVKQNKTVERKKEMLTHVDYENGTIFWRKYRIPEIKAILKHYKLHITGNKLVLIDRLSKYFESCISAIKIQKIFRGYIVKNLFQLKGPAFKKRQLCVNETDGYTLEPVTEIEFERFFSYKDCKDFIYGFDIGGLLRLYKTKGKINNPYTRDRIENKILNDILFLGRVLPIVFPNVLTDDEKIVTNYINYRYPTIGRRRVFPHSFSSLPYRQNTPQLSLPLQSTSVANSRPEILQRLNNLIQLNNSNNHTNIGTNTNTNTIHPVTDTTAITSPFSTMSTMTPGNDITMTIPYHAQNDRTQPYTFTPQQRELYIKLLELRNRDFLSRITHLFMEIDLLGNYTQSSWFSGLNISELSRYFRILFDIWNYRAQMSSETKRNICQFGNPFMNIYIPPRISNNYHDIHIENRIRDSCLTVMELIVFSGTDIEYRKIGALHVLSALTVVSYEARGSMYWLYDSLL